MAIPSRALLMNLLAADVNRLIILPGMIRADSHRLLQFRGNWEEASQIFGLACELAAL